MESDTFLAIRTAVSQVAMAKFKDCNLFPRTLALIAKYHFASEKGAHINSGTEDAEALPNRKTFQVNHRPGVICPHTQQTTKW